MLADIHQIITEAETKMSSAIRYLDDELARIRAGKASPRILDNVKVSYYGSMTPLATRCQNDDHHSMGKTDVEGD